MLKQIHSDCCEVSTPAKLNLFLEVLGKRPDGYHELETLMVTINLFDTLRFSLVDALSVTLSNRWCRRTPASMTSQLPAGPDNLVLKAAHLLARETGTRRGAHIELFKRIPLAAGLAGGSSDAAATLIGLNRLWDLRLSLNELRSLGAQLGSDVPFFLAGTGAAICRGRGEIIESISLGTALHFVIAKPEVGLSTAQVFQNCQPAQSPNSIADLVRSLHRGHLSNAGCQMFNRLNAPAERLCHPVSALRRRFEQLPVMGHLMSGSGTSYFGLCRNAEQARQLAGRLQATQSGQVFAVRTCI